MTTTAHLLCFNEADILRFTLRHYATFCQRIICHDLGSTDGSQALVTQAGFEVNQHDCRAEFDDRLNQKIKNEEWRGIDCDWTIMADADELLYFPMGAPASLEAYMKAGVSVVKPYGFEMFSEVFPTGEGQITDQIKMGARDDRWYGKPIMFSPKLVQSVLFGVGAHEITGTLKTGRQFGNPNAFSEPPCYLLHMHHIRPQSEIAARYEGVRARLSAINKKMKWGLQESGMAHAARKRDGIVPKLQRVVL